MSKVLLVQTVFCPTRQLLQKQLDSLFSLNAYWRQYPEQADFYLSGYVHDEFLDEFRRHTATAAPGLRCTFLRFKENLGKAYVVNEAVKFALGRDDAYRYLLTFDSDICFNTEEANLLPRLINLSYRIEDEMKKPCGLIACNFSGDNPHWLDRFENRRKIDDEIISWPSRAGAPGGGIAGGCIFVDMQAWLRVDGYRRQLGVYAPDDGYLMIDLESAGYHSCVAETMRVHHPPAASSESVYEAWKQEATRRFTAHLVTGTPIDFTEDRAAADRFWEARKRSGGE